MRAVALLLVLLATACARAPLARSEPPVARVITTPVEVYVPIDPKLRERCPWKRDCSPSEGIACSKERGKCLRFYETNLDGIDQIQGTPVPRAGKP